MNTEFDLYGFDLPCGLIHDQKLSNVKVENDTIVLTFDIELYPQDYSDDTIYNDKKLYYVVLDKMRENNSKKKTENVTTDTNEITTEKIYE